VAEPATEQLLAVIRPTISTISKRTPGGAGVLDPDTITNAAS
jgi:hypothetical protein